LRKERVEFAGPRRLVELLQQRIAVSWIRDATCALAAREPCH